MEANKSEYSKVSLLPYFTKHVFTNKVHNPTGGGWYFQKNLEQDISN